MDDKDVQEIKKLAEDIRKRIKSESDLGASGQYATYNYIATKSEDVKKWAAGTKVGNELLQTLKTRKDYLKNNIDYTLKLTDIVVKFAEEQAKINSQKVS